jgi:hypothetical protein
MTDCRLSLSRMVTLTLITRMASLALIIKTRMPQKRMRKTRLDLRMRTRVRMM